MSSADKPLTDLFHDERLAFADLARDLARKKLVENLEENDLYPFGELFTEAIKDAGTVGFYGINLSSEHSGIGMGPGMAAVIMEQISQYDASLAGVIFTNAAALEIMSSAAADYDGNALLSGISSIGTVPLAFPSFSCPEDMEIPSPDSRGLISGTLKYLTLGNIADYAVVPAGRGEDSGFSWYLVKMDDPSLSISEPVLSLGFHACPSVDISFNSTAGKLIGAEGKGREYFESVREGMSLCAAAISLGIMKGSYMSSLEYTNERYQGGRQIIDWPQVRMMLADMAIEIRIGDSAVQRACQELENECPEWRESALAAAIHIGELSVKATSTGVQLFGGNGYMKDYPQEKRMRDARQAQALLGMPLLKKMGFINRIIEEN